MNRAYNIKKFYVWNSIEYQHLNENLNNKKIKTVYNTIVRSSCLYLERKKKSEIPKQDLQGAHHGPRELAFTYSSMQMPTSQRFLGPGTCYSFCLELESWHMAHFPLILSVLASTFFPQESLLSSYTLLTLRALCASLGLHWIISIYLFERL